MSPSPGLIRLRGRRHIPHDNLPSPRTPSFEVVGLPVAWRRRSTCRAVRLWRPGGALRNRRRSTRLGTPGRLWAACLWHQKDGLLRHRSHHRRALNVRGRDGAYQLRRRRLVRQLNWRVQRGPDGGGAPRREPQRRRRQHMPVRHRRRAATCRRLWRHNQCRLLHR